MDKDAGLYRVLIVEDDQDYAGLLRDALASISSDIAICDNGEEAVRKARVERPDLILLDIFLLGIDGLHTLARLKAEPATSEIPIIIITSLRRGQLKERAIEAGAAQFLLKSLPPQEILGAIKEVLSRHDDKYKTHLN